MPFSLSAAERRSAGQKYREHLPRSQHRNWNPRLRQQNPLTLLRRSMRGRLPQLLDLRYHLMGVSPFGFFRGAVSVMAYDLSLLPNTGILTQICGDAHVRNLGAYAGIDGHLVFDINDFDETARAPFEWDLKRLATSVLLAGRAVHIKSSLCEEAVTTLLERYRKSMRLFTEMPVLELARYPVRRLGHIQSIAAILGQAERATPLRNLQTLTVLPGAPKPHLHNAVRKATRTTSSTAFDLAAAAAPARQFRSAPPELERVTGAAAEDVLHSLSLYRKSLEPERRHFLDQYRPLDVAFKVVGTGSVGLRDFCVYLEGNGSNDPLFLQIKQEVPSAYTPYLTDPPAATLHQGRRVVDGQRAMQLQSDPFLGWTTIAGRDFLVRQLNDHKGSLDIGTLAAEELTGYADLCGELLARGHARAGDPLAIFGYIGKSARFDKAILKFSSAYADQTERDWKQLVRAGHL